MKRTDEMQGRRLPDWEFTRGAAALPMEPGDYVKVLGWPFPIAPTNLTGAVWYFVTPNGIHGSLAAHTVRENEDGTISVKPGDGSSNSILAQHGDSTWHGYITNGLWWSLA